MKNSLHVNPIIKHFNTKLLNLDSYYRSYIPTSFKDLIIFEDNHLLVLYKPPRVLSQSDRSGDESIVTACQRYLVEFYNKPGRAYVGLVHRLDRPCSGVLALAKTSKCASRLSHSFRSKNIMKKYFAVVHGVPKLKKGVCFDHDLEPDFGTQGNDLMTTPALEYELLDSVKISRDDTRFHDISILDITLKIGKKHQIRRQLSNLGLPILGDTKYSGSRYEDFADLGRSIPLHSYCLSFPHPTTREQVTITADPPSSWRSILGENMWRTVCSLSRKSS